MRHRAAAALAVLLSTGPVAWVSAEEWHEAYRNGLAALARGQGARAVELLQRAIQKRPEPGRNVVTYGTNVEERYYPYLRLGEAFLQVGNLEGARDALRRSEAWAREPPEDRAKLAARVEEAAERARPRPPPTTLPAPSEPPLAARPPTTPVPAPAATPATAPPAAEPGAGATSPPPTERGALTVERRPGSRPAPQPELPAESPRRRTADAVPAPPAWRPAAPEAAEAGPPSAGSLVIFSEPAGASVFLDDEPFGATDPESGRWVKNGLPAGRHQLRLSAPRHQDLQQELDVVTGAATTFRGALAPTAATDDGRTLAGIALLVFVAGLGISVWVWRSRSRGPGDPARLRALLAEGSGGWSRRSTPRRPAGLSSATPPRTPTPGPLAEPEDFGEYRLVEVLGRGGMAAVYRAERRADVCALKRPLNAFLDDPEFLERFLREAEIGRTLHHPNIVRILDRGEVDHVPFFTMELVEGETLLALLRRRGPLPPRDAAALVANVAEALDYAHLKGVVHRDLKPSNVMVTDTGLVKVMDYGIARARRFEGLTLTGAFLGTPEYVAPETVEARGTDGRSDLYSLGVVFYEVLTGRRPFTGETPYVALRRQLTEDPLPPSAVNPAVPAELERIVLRLLQKDPAQRHPAAEELVVELRDYLNRAA